MTFGKNETSEVCKKNYKKSNEVDKKKLNILRKGIEQNYQHHW